MAKTLGQIAYEAYLQSVGGKSFRGEALPDWNQLCARTGDADKRVVVSWQVCAEAVAEEVRNNGMARCDICSRALSKEIDCGGTCVFCMAEAGDPECVEKVKKMITKSK